MSRGPGLLTVATCVIAMSGAVGASAGELPSLKPGLWEIKLVEGMPKDADAETMKAWGTTKMCIDKDTDELLTNQSRQLRESGKQECDLDRTSSSGSTYTSESLCPNPAGAGKVRSKVVMTFEGGTFFRTEMEMKYEPPSTSEKDSRSVSEARWLGVCEAGQVPGDMILGNGMKMNMLKIMGAAEKKK
jgi:hypothetical protein